MAGSGSVMSIGMSKGLVTDRASWISERVEKKKVSQKTKSNFSLSLVGAEAIFLAKRSNVGKSCWIRRRPFRWRHIRCSASTLCECR